MTIWFLISAVWEATTLILPAMAQVNLPPVNLADSNFLDGVAFPGFLLQERISYYHADSFRNHDGSKKAGDNSISLQVSMTQVAYLSKYHLLSGCYGAEVLLPIVSIDPDTDFGLEEKEKGIGDLIVSPFLLQWTDHQLLGRPFFHRLNFIFILPIGEYDKNADVNPSSNCYSFNPYYAFTSFITPRLETSIRLAYLWNGKNHDPKPVFGVDDIQAGQAFYVNYAASYEIVKGWRLGFAGYFLKQITRHKMGGHKVNNSKERVVGIGPGLYFRDKSIFLYLNTFFESAVENRAEGMKVNLRFKKVF